MAGITHQVVQDVQADLQLPSRAFSIVCRDPKNENISNYILVLPVEGNRYGSTHIICPKSWCPLRSVSLPAMKSKIGSIMSFLALVVPISFSRNDIV